MKKIDYFKLAVKNKLHEKLDWIVSVFALTQSNSSENKNLYKIVSNNTGHYFYNESSQLEKIEDALATSPIYRFLEPITIDSSWIINAPKEPVETTYGNVIFNLCTVVNAFGNKIDFILGQVDLETIENQIAKKLIEDDQYKEGSGQIKISEYIKFVDSLQYIGNFSSLCTISATIKNIQVAPGFEAFKKELIKKYDQKLSDPTEYAKFEAELKAYDDEYLKDDPSTKTFLKGRIRNIARKKMFLTLGSEQSFNESQSRTPVINSLHERWPIDDPQQFTAMMNTLRFGSFSRGSETERGGVAAKILLRSGNHFKITDTDCQTTYTLTRIYQKSNLENLVGRYIVENNKLKLIETLESAQTYLGKAIKVRSPMYCKSSGDTICKICAGQKLSNFPNGLTIPLTDMSNIILYTSMKAMHGKVLSTATINIDESLS